MFFYARCRLEQILMDTNIVFLSISTILKENPYSDNALQDTIYLARQDILPFMGFTNMIVERRYALSLVIDVITLLFKH